MIELRADGTIPGAPKIGRIYLMAHDGVLHYQSCKVEFESDWPEYIEKYDTFRGFTSGFLPIDELNTKLAALRKAGFGPEEMKIEKVRHLKQKAKEAHKESIKALEAYIKACEGVDEGGQARAEKALIQLRDVKLR